MEHYCRMRCRLLPEDIDWLISCTVDTVPLNDWMRQTVHIHSAIDRLEEDRRGRREQRRDLLKLMEFTRCLMIQIKITWTSQFY